MSIVCFILWWWLYFRLFYGWYRTVFSLDDYISSSEFFSLQSREKLKTFIDSIIHTPFTWTALFWTGTSEIVPGILLEPSLPVWESQHSCSCIIDAAVSRECHNLSICLLLLLVDQHYIWQAAHQSGAQEDPPGGLPCCYQSLWGLYPTRTSNPY